MKINTYIHKLRQEIRELRKNKSSANLGSEDAREDPKRLANIKQASGHQNFSIGASK